MLIPCPNDDLYAPMLSDYAHIKAYILTQHVRFFKKKVLSDNAYT